LHGLRDHRRALLAHLRLRLWCRCGHRIDLSLREIAKFAGSQLSKLQGTHAHAHEASHLQPHHDTHAAHLALPTGEEHQRDARAPARARTHRHANGARDSLFEWYPTLQARKGLIGEVALDPDVVLALVAVARMQHALGPGAIVREKQQPLRVRVEPAHRIEALTSTDVVYDGPSTVLVLGGRNDPDRFVHQHIAVRRRRGNESTIDLDVRIFEDARAERGDQVAVHPDPTLGDHLFGRTA
jgi:hypothetical protein